MAENDVPLGTVISDAITTLARTLRLELSRMMLGLVVRIIIGILLLTAAIVFTVVGIMRLGDALGRVCGQWFGNEMMGDIVVGLVFLSIPLAGILLLRQRAKK